MFWPPCLILIAFRLSVRRFGSGRRTDFHNCSDYSGRHLPGPGRCPGTPGLPAQNPYSALCRESGRNRYPCKRPRNGSGLISTKPSCAFSGSELFAGAVFSFCNVCICAIANQAITASSIAIRAITVGRHHIQIHCIRIHYSRIYSLGLHDFCVYRLNIRIGSTGA